MHTQYRSWLALGFATMLVAACAKKDTTTRDDSLRASPGEVAAVRVASIDVGRSLGTDKSIADKTDTFSRTDTIYASVATEGSGNATLKARWTFEDGQVVDESTQSTTPTGPARTEFHVAKPGGWPAGKYKVEISINDTPAGSKDFTIK
jgi:hypothetical protein